ncbi:MAG TPA: hypothetical protein VHQ65_05935 [Thermoanaerobaculia bacterium]|nr:hypothetical protein [Thermoanaerobaculia bacterium]
MRIVSKSLALVLFVVLAAWALLSERGLAEDAGGGPPSAAAAAAAPALTGGDAAWRHDPLWDDGRAEYCAYEVEWARYGELWPGRALLVLVKEPWAPELDVKADAPRRDGFDVLKLNHVRDVPTGIYTYHQMASAFLRRDRGEVVKLATSSAEACGLTTAELVDGRLATRSYFDGQGDRTVAYPGGLPEDALPALLRDAVAAPEGALPQAVDVFPSLLAGKLPPLVPESFALERREVGELRVPAGSFPAVAVELRNDSGSRTYRFEQAPPHRLLAYDGADGTTYRLARCDRLAYWQRNRPGDEEWWPRSLR